MGEKVIRYWDWRFEADENGDVKGEMDYWLGGVSETDDMEHRVLRFQMEGGAFDKNSWALLGEPGERIAEAETDWTVGEIREMFPFLERAAENVSALLKKGNFELEETGYQKLSGNSKTRYIDFKIGEARFWTEFEGKKLKSLLAEEEYEVSDAGFRAAVEAKITKKGKYRVRFAVS